MSRMAGPKSRSGRLSAMEMSSKKSQTSQKSTTARTELGTRAKSKMGEKATTSSKKTGHTTTSAAKSGGARSGRSSGKSLKSETKKAKQTVRSKSALGVPSVRPPDVLPFESPPPQPKLLSQPQSLVSLTENTSEDSASAMIRSVSIIDDDSDLGDPFDEVKRTLPRIRVGDGEPSEYKVKAYFLDELDDFPMPAPFDSGVIPSSPVEVDATTATSVQRDALPEHQPSTTHVDDVIAASVHAVPSRTVLETGTAEQTCNNTDGAKGDAIKTETSVSESVNESASIEARRRDPKYETTSFPELGMDFLPEFENEVNGLLDTLMSQDLLTNTFSQDLRLFSTESNFMESCMDANEPSSSSQRFSEQEVLLEDTTKEAIQEENETLQTIVEDVNDLSLQTTVAAPMEHVTVETKHTSQTSDTENKDDSSQGALHCLARSADTVFDDDVTFCQRLSVKPRGKQTTMMSIGIRRKIERQLTWMPLSMTNKIC